MTKQWYWSKSYKCRWTNSIFLSLDTRLIVNNILK